MSDHEHAATSATQQLCTFHVGAHFFGVPVLHVQEVIRAQQMTIVPLAHAAVAGLINLRGQIVTAVDMRRHLDMPARDNDREPTNVILRTADGAVSLLVDDIGDVIEVDGATLAPVPPSMTGAARRMLTGVHVLKNQLLMVLDPERAVTLGTT